VTTFKIAPSQLMAIVDRVAPFAGTNKIEGPVIAAIRLQGDGGVIYSSATNRYVAAISSTDVEHGEPFDVMIDAADLKLARRLYPVPRRRLTDEKPITVDLAPGVLGLSQSSASPAIAVQFRQVEGRFPLNLRERMAEWIGRRKQPSGRPVAWAFDPQLLRKFDHLGHHLEMHPVLPDPNNKTGQPVLVFADRFAGAIMTRGRDGQPDLVGPWSLQPSLEAEQVGS
jgi:hypothetical protein